jgi:hypothetical protein
MFPVEQFPFGQGAIQNIVWFILSYAVLIIFFMFSNRIQISFWLREAAGALNKLKFMRDEARRISIETIKSIGKPTEDPTPRIDQFLEYLFIEPTSMNPAGIVSKFDHLLDVRDLRFKDEVRLIAPAADETQLNTLENLLEASLDLNSIYKVVRHYYLFGKKTNSLYIIMQLQMLMPLLMQIAEAYMGAANAFANGQPIGDGAGAFVAAKLMHGKEFKKIEKDMIVSEVPIDGRKAFVLKAEGPGGNVGKPGDAIKTIIDQCKGKVSMVVMIDAQQKLEGENSGDSTEAIGAAIGGVGTEKYKIEESISKYKIPVNAILIKESIQEAISPMKKEIVKGVDNAVAKVKRLIAERTKEGDIVIIAGIGNTVGIGQ